MIDIELVPENVREMLETANMFTAEIWAQVTPDWDPFYQAAALIFRKMGEEARIDALRQRRNDMEKYIEEMGGPGGNGVLAIAIFCLSDEKLDLAISTLSPGLREKYGV